MEPNGTEMCFAENLAKERLKAPKKEWKKEVSKLEIALSTKIHLELLHPDFVRLTNSCCIKDCQLCIP